ncbi:MAG: agmatine deiminase family protein [Ignavibacteriae bacterium]|nr:agmatine deiminase family protein [Ignavibacteriota bacterium]
MKKFVLFLFAILFVSVSVYSQFLPNYLTEYEKKIYPYYIPPVGNEKDVNPPYNPVRTIAEWEENQAVMVTWTSYTSIIAQIVDYIQDECICLIICTDSNSVKSQLTSFGVPLTNLAFLIKPFNSVWNRDYGQWNGYTNEIDSLKMIDWIYNRPRPSDDQIPVYVAQFFNVPLHQAITSPNDLTHTGGNFMVDGHGTGFASKLILQENSGKTEAQIDTIAKKYLGLNRFIKMETLPYDGIHHIDMHMKLLDEETLLVGQYPTGVSDGPQIEANLQYVLNNFQTCFGKPYKVVRIPQPPSSSGQYPPNSSYFTYTNSLIVNKTVLVPIYGFALDTTALRIYRQAMPGYRVVGINCSSMISASGAIHCITKEIGIVNPVFISHSGLRNTNVTSSPYEVKARIKTKTGIANAKVYWRTDTLNPYSLLNMTQLTADTFRAYIPAQSLNTKVYYYISATSNNSKTITKPLTAPSGYFTFTISNTTSAENNGIIPQDYRLYQNYPNPFNPATVIKYQIPKDGLVSLKVYDVLGREVAVLVNEFKKSGLYEAALSLNSENLSSGMYFYRLNSGGFSDTKKFVICK